MKTLTKREKILLYILLCVIIVVGGFSLCMPALESNQSLKAQNDALDLQLASVRASIIEYKDLDKKIEEATKEYQGELDKFYIAENMKVEDVDNLITNLAQNYGLTPVSLQISDITSEELISYQEFLSQQAQKSENKEEKKKDAQNIKVYNVTLKIKGTISNLQAMVNEANQTKTLKVNGVNYTDQKEEDKEMSVTFKLFMI